ncbi:hypothetical protein EJ08DRAFT_228787 [Tothia fuscella]|uniref:Uncharacterized protein n=1 Tax=Tothia fuscella TaxID=1048955 RepID=A0A9P4U4K8_9PEZI|nr:hypothetical protein EJ08DRAFT_228787 [Tothia fuscella]
MGAIGNLIPLVMLFAFVGGLAYFGYQLYDFANELSERGKKKMEKKNISFTKDGMKVGVKEKRQEDYEDKTQSVLVKAWNFASFPGYKSKVWNTEATPGFRRTSSGTGTPSGSRPPTSRT